MSFNITDYGAVADGTTQNAPFIQRAINECARSGGGRVIIPAGTFLSGTIRMKSNVELHLAEGARLLASPNLDDYNDEDEYPQNFCYRDEEWCGKHLIIAIECENIAFTGSGIIDGNGGAYYAEPIFFDRFIWRDGLSLSRDKVRLRPGQLVCIVESINITVRDITVKNATSWCIFLHGCENAKIFSVKIYNPKTYANTDGINIDACKNVTVTDCHIDTGDDAIPIRCNTAMLKNKDRICEHISIRNCTLASSSSVFRFGIGNVCRIKDVDISNIRILRGGVCLHFMVSYARHVSELSDIRISNVTAENISYPLEITGSKGYAKSLSIKNFESDAYTTSRIVATDECRVEDLTLENVTIRKRALVGDGISYEPLEISGVCPIMKYIDLNA